jgi:hypothetical protein
MTNNYSATLMYLYMHSDPEDSLFYVYQDHKWKTLLEGIVRKYESKWSWKPSCAYGGALFATLSDKWTIHTLVDHPLQ